MKKNNLYFYTVILTMFIFPLISILLEVQFFNHHQALVEITGKWFVFWVVGVRIFLAGLKQVVDPEFTLKKIFKIEHKESSVIVRELGFSNICLGMLGILSLPFVQFRMPAAIMGGLFLGLTGILHTIRNQASQNESIAMLSNLFLFLVLFFYVVSRVMIQTHLF